MENESSVKQLIENSLEQIRTIIDADTVVGKQIVTPSGAIIIPISKVSMAFASGGLDLPAKRTNADGYTSKNFGGGGGTGVSVTPVGFLTVTPEGEVSMLPMTQEKATPIEQIADIINSTPDLIGRIKNIFTGDKNAAADEEKEAEYQQKLADAAMEELEKEVDEEEDYDTLPEEEEEVAPLTRAERRQLRKEEKLRRKMEKKGVPADDVVFTDDLDTPTRIVKKGKLSDRTLDKGELR